MQERDESNIVGKISKDRAVGHILGIEMNSSYLYIRDDLGLQCQHLQLQLQGFPSRFRYKILLFLDIRETRQLFALGTLKLGVHI